MVVVPLFLVLSGSFFWAQLDTYLNFSTPTETMAGVEGLSVMGHLLIPFFRSLISIFIFVVPILTMRAFSEEKKSGTYELLVSYPLQPAQILLGKLLGLVSIVLGLLLLSGIYPAFVMWQAEPHVPQILTAYLGYALFLLLYVTVGVVISLFTENQLISAFLTFLFFLASYLIQLLAHYATAPLDAVFSNFLVIAHLETFRSGMLLLGDLFVYPCLTIIVFLIGLMKLNQHSVR
jgi:ABC-2 type transport system permease protein